MNKKLNIYIIFGILFTILSGMLLHFTYEWSGSNPIVGLFSPVNESVWEHLKLLFYPMSLWTLFGYFKFKDQKRNFICAALIGLVSGLLLIPLLFYSYTSITGQNYIAADISIFILSTCIAFFINRYILKNYNLRFWSVKLLIFLWEIIFALFVIFTILKPDIALFR